MSWTYWKRRIPADTADARLIVGALYRRSDAGEYQTFTGGAWVTVPGDSIGPLTAEGDPMMSVIPQHDASCPDPTAPVHSALSCDVPDFRSVRPLEESQSSLTSELFELPAIGEDAERFPTP